MERNTRFPPAPDATTSDPLSDNGAEQWDDQKTIRPQTSVVDSRDALQLTLDGFEGPIDLLLSLAREHKIDLSRLQILPLAEQYLLFIEQAQKLDLEIAADYLVMAAYLSYLKSKLLLPVSGDDEVDDENLAENLAWRLQQLEAMQLASKQLQNRPRLGVDIFPRLSPDHIETRHNLVYDISFYDLVRDYGQIESRRTKATPLKIAPTRLHSMETALDRLREILGLSDHGGLKAAPEWIEFDGLELGVDEEPLVQRSIIAASFLACLELARTNELTLRQADPAAPLYVRAKA